jgi:SNF2 family DNA or RNA helicase
MTPYELVASHYQLPFDLYPFQVKGVDELGPLPRAGYYFDTGTGKSITSTASALYKRMDEGRRTIVLMPPILTKMWHRSLNKIPGVTNVIYAGTPAERKKINLDADFILMSIHIFKREYEDILGRMDGKLLTIIVDEATSIKSIESANHKSVMAAVNQMGAHLMLLTATPLSSPADAYAYCKFLAPGRYRNQRHFENMHVEKVDFFGNPMKWTELEYMKESMEINSMRVLKEEVLLDLPEVTYTPIHYDLDSKHYALYQKLANEQLLELETGGKIDATTPNALYHALQQIVVNYDYFADNDQCESNALSLMDEVLEEIGDEKLIVFSHYRLTNQALLRRMKKYGIVAVYGGITQAQQSRNVDKFIEDKGTRILAAQVQSAGYGIDGLQDVCNNVLFLELPMVPKDFHQAVARVHRNGQRRAVNIRIGIAEKTMQQRLFSRMMDKDALVNRVQGGFADLRDSIFGKN